MVTWVFYVVDVCFLKQAARRDMKMSALSIFRLSEKKVYISMYVQTVFKFFCISKTFKYLVNIHFNTNLKDITTCSPMIIIPCACTSREEDERSSHSVVINY